MNETYHLDDEQKDSNHSIKMQILFMNEQNKWESEK